MTTTPPSGLPAPGAHRLTPRWRARWRRGTAAQLIGVVVLAAGAVALADTSRTVSCQNDAFDTAQANQVKRGQVVEDERGVDRQLVIATLGTDNPRELRAARQRWVADSDRLDADRRAHPYPEPRSCRR